MQFDPRYRVPPARGRLEPGLWLARLAQECQCSGPSTSLGWAVDGRFVRRPDPGDPDFGLSSIHLQDSFCYSVITVTMWSLTTRFSVRLVEHRPTAWEKASIACDALELVWVNVPTFCRICRSLSAIMLVQTPAHSEQAHQCWVRWVRGTGLSRVVEEDMSLM